MTTIGQMAKISLRGFDKQGVTSKSAIEDQVELVWRAAREHGKRAGFKPYTHRGIRGIKGPLVMTRIVRSLFPELTGDDFKTYNSVIYQVLRRTDTAVCVHHPEKDSGESPEWFISDKLPANFTVIAVGLKKSSADQQRAEQRQMTHTERRLTPHEAGEDRAPGEVTVTMTDKKRAPRNSDLSEEERRAQRISFLQDHHERARREHEELTKAVLEELSTNPQPMSVNELTPIVQKNLGREVLSTSTIRTILEEQLEAGGAFSRKETKEEALIRGGGKMPRATRPTLWSTSNPVPTRTALPAGIEPLKSAAEYAEEARETRKRHDEAVLDTLTNASWRTVGKIAEHVGLTNDQVKLALERLIHKGDVYRDENNGNRYYLSSRRRPAPEVVPADQLETLVGTPAPTEAVTNPHLARLLEYAEQLVNHQADGSKVAALEKQVQDLTQENARLAEAVTNLRAALNALS